MLSVTLRLSSTTDVDFKVKSFCTDMKRLSFEFYNNIMIYTKCGTSEIDLRSQKILRRFIIAVVKLRASGKLVSIFWNIKWLYIL